MVKVVYFNQWFSSIGDVINDIKNKHGGNLKIIGSSKNENHVYKIAVDTFIVEDWEHNYVDWALELCKNNSVDIFFVKRYAKEVMRRASEFIEIGVHIICENYNTLIKLNKKSSVYKRLSDDVVLNFCIPDYATFSESNDAINYIKSHIESQGSICMKLDIDEGGTSFRRIIQGPLDIESLNKTWANTITMEQAIDIINYAHSEDLKKIIFMEELDGPEVSVDCYNSKNGLITICREKLDKRLQRIYYDSCISIMCAKIQQKYNFEFPFNIQFRYKHTENGDRTANELRLLEINPRLSGGTYIESKAGLNIAEVCLLDSINMSNKYNINKFRNFSDKLVSHMETAVEL